MKKILFLILLITSVSYGQTTLANKLKITGNTTSASTAKINTQETDGQINHIPATSLPVSTATANALDLRTENSSGAIQGFAITNNGDGTVNIATGTAYLRTTNDPYSPLIKYVIPSVTNLALTDNANNFILVDYNGGSPALTVTLSAGTINTTTNSIAYVISRVGTTLDYISLVGQNVDANGKLRRRFLNSEGLRRAQGAVLTGSNRNLLLTSGLYYSGLIEVSTPAFNTSTGSTFTQAYNNGTWVRTTGNTQINNTQYSLAGVLTTMPTNDYRVDYVYILADNPSKLYVLLGSTTYANINDARLAPVPVSLPSELQFLGTRVGRVIIRKDATTMEVSSEFATIYQAGSATLHNDLGGLNLGDFQHLTATEKTNLEYITNKATTFTTVNNTLYPSVQAVKTQLDLKANLASPNFTGLVNINGGMGDTTILKGQDGGAETFTLNKNGTLKASRYELYGGLSSQFLKADGSTDSTNYSSILNVVETGTSFSLDNTYNGKVVILTSSCTVTIPNGLVAGFECSFVTLAGVTQTVSLGGSVVLFNNTGTTMAEKLSFTLKNRTATNNYITVGSL